MADMPLVVRLALTAIFAGTGWYCLRRCVGPAAAAADWTTRVNYTAHLAMGTAMTAMIWTPPRFVPWQMAFFGVACAWFAAQAIGVQLSVASNWVAVDGGVAMRASRASHGAADRMHCLAHAAVMAGMVWMLAVMSPTHDGMIGRPMGGAAWAARPSESWVAGSCCIAAGLLLVVLGRVIPRTSSSRCRVTEDLNHAVMTAGMGIMALAMA